MKNSLGKIVLTSLEYSMSGITSNSRQQRRLVHLPSYVEIRVERRTWSRHLRFLKWTIVEA